MSILNRASSECNADSHKQICTLESPSGVGTISFELKDDTEITVRVKKNHCGEESRIKRDLPDFSNVESKILLFENGWEMGIVQVGREYETRVIVKDTDGHLINLPEGWGNVDFHIVGQEALHGAVSIGPAPLGEVRGKIKILPPSSGSMYLFAVINIDGQSIGTIASSNIAVAA